MARADEPNGGLETDCRRLFLLLLLLFFYLKLHRKRGRTPRCKARPDMAKATASMRVRAKALRINVLSSTAIRTTARNFGPLLLGKISAFPPKYEIKGVPRSLLRRLYLLLYLRGMSGNNHRFVRRARRLAEELHERVAAANPRRDVEPLPVVHVDDLVEEDFRRDYYLQYHPVVVRGLPLNVDHWSLDWFIEQYGDSKVLFTDPGTQKNFTGPLSLLKTQEPPPYLHNCAQIFQQNPSLLGDLNLDRLSAIIRAELQYTQAFFGTTIGSGTQFHCAFENNFFFQVKGRKRWTFVDSNYTFLMYPYLTQTNTYQTCVASGLSGNSQDDKLPLLKYCPRFQATLEPGDVLLSPSWWWHAVENVTPETVGVATRWTVPDKRQTNRLYSILAEASPQVLVARQKLVEHALAGGAGGTALFNTDYTFEEAHPFEVFSHDTSFEDVKNGQGLLAWFGAGGRT